MSEIRKMKLTEESLKTIMKNPIFQRDDIIQQILEDQEKAEFWDKTYNELVTDECEVNNNSMAFFCLKEDLQQLQEYEQEIKQLKKDKQILSNVLQVEVALGTTHRQEIDNLKQKLEIQDSKNKEKEDSVDPYYKKVESILGRYLDCLIELTMYHQGDHNIDREYFELAKDECIEDFKNLTDKDIKDL